MGTYFVVLFLQVIKMKPIKKAISITLDDDIVDRLKVLSENWDRSVSSCINIILKEYFSTKKDG